MAGRQLYVLGNAYTAFHHCQWKSIFKGPKKKKKERKKKEERKQIYDIMLCCVIKQLLLALPDRE